MLVLPQDLAISEDHEKHTTDGAPGQGALSSNRQGKAASCIVAPSFSAHSGPLWALLALVGLPARSSLAGK